VLYNESAFFLSTVILSDMSRFIPEARWGGGGKKRDKLVLKKINLVYEENG